MLADRLNVMAFLNGLNLVAEPWPLPGDRTAPLVNRCALYPTDRGQSGQRQLLPAFLPPERFAHLWEEIGVALAPGGRFCGQLFGDQDSWAAYTDCTHHRRTHHHRTQVNQLLEPFTVEWLDEENHPGQTALGEEKH